MQVDRFAYLPDGRMVTIEMPTGPALVDADAVVKLRVKPAESGAQPSKPARTVEVIWGKSKVLQFDHSFCVVNGGLSSPPPAPVRSSNQHKPALLTKHSVHVETQHNTTVGTGQANRQAKSGDTANLGIVQTLMASPEAGEDGVEPKVAMTNHRLELLVMSPRRSGGRWQVQVVDTAVHESGITGVCWSPCGRWLAYSKATSEATVRCSFLIRSVFC
jgi:hypothetical protein